MQWLQFFNSFGAIFKARKTALEQLCTGAATQVAVSAGWEEPILAVQIGNTMFQALTDRGSSVSLRGMPGAKLVEETGAKHRTQVRALCLATGWSQSKTSLKCKIQWDTSSCNQRLMCVPELCRDTVLGKHLLSATGISIYVALGGWTIGTVPQCIMPFTH